MKVINREYGFLGRPPFFDDFYEEFSGIQTAFNREKILKPVLGMGLDIKVPTGFALFGHDGNNWGVKISYFKLGREMEPSDFVKTLPDYFTENFSKKFSYFSGGDITCRVLEYSQGEAVFMLSALDRARVKLEFYSLNDKNSSFNFSENELIGISKQYNTVKGEMSFKEKMTEIRERYLIDEDNGKKNKFYLKAFSAPDIVEDEGARFSLEYALDEKNSRALFYIKLGEKIEILPDEEEILNGISAVELEFSSEKLTGSGVLARRLEQAFNTLMYNRIYDPYLNSLVYIRSRDEADKHFSYRGDHLALSAIFSVLHGSIEDAFLQAELSCTDKTLGAFGAWFVFSRTRNKDFLKKVYERLIEVWAPSGALSVTQNNEEESVGYRYFNTAVKMISEPLYAVDASCYRLLAYEIIYKMGEILKDKKRAQDYKAAHQKLKEEINLKLFDDETKIYIDKKIKGGFCGAVSALGFLPLFSGAVDSAEKCEALIGHLTDTKEFWSSAGVTFMPKNSPHFKARKFNLEENAENRAVYPLLNFMIYIGLRRYGIDAPASELALKSAKIWEKYFNRYRGVPDVYFKGMDLEKRTKLALEGNLMAYVGMFEILDVEYFNSELRPSISFGTMAKGTDHGVSNAKLFNKKISINVQDKLTRLYIDGRLMFEGEGGRFEIRHFMENSDGAEFLIAAASPVLVSLYLPFFTSLKPVSLIKLMAPEGKSRIKIVKGKATIEKFNS